jgi:alpha-glucosidase (family GH31 glycosyl hydrolase)
MKNATVGSSILLGLMLGCGGKSADDTAPIAPEAPWPEWAFHHWVWEDESTQESALALVHDYLDRDIPVGAIIIDSPWATGYSTFEWDPALFPDPQAMIDELHALDVRVFVWTVSGINVDETALYETAAANDWFMKTAADRTDPAVVSWWKGEGSLLDYWNEDAVEWWHGLVDNTLAYGIDGWKTDGLDYYAALTPYSPGLGASVTRLEYSHAYYRDFHDYTREQLGDDRILTARPVDNYGFGLGGDTVAFSPVDLTWAGWVGDQDATFEGLEAALNNYYHSADYGYVAFGSDIGGYRDEGDIENGRTKEVFLRWAQLGAFSPIMENGGGGEHRPWMWDEETTEIYRDFVELHYALIPYLMTQGAVAFEAGVSLMNFSDIERYAYRLGEDLFVQPIFTASGTEDLTSSVTVTFPDGDWVDLFNRSQHYPGGSTETFSVPISTYPVFVRADSELAETLAAR